MSEVDSSSNTFHLDGLKDNSASMVCGMTTVPPSSASHPIEFVLSWDIPIARFPIGHSWLRRYISIILSSNSLLDFQIDLSDIPEKNISSVPVQSYRSSSPCAVLSDYAFSQISQIREKIIQWQRPIVIDRQIPGWLRGLVHNELYFLTAGGCIWTTHHGPNTFDSTISRGIDWNTSTPGWTDFEQIERKTLKALQQKLLELENTHDESEASPNDPLSRLQHQMHQSKFHHLGHFLFLEGLEYLMWNTYDVLFYASWAILDLFPDLEMTIQLDFTRAILDNDPIHRSSILGTHKAQRKRFGCVPHDLGGPTDVPIFKYNTYNIHHTDDWKDLPSKYILQVWRDYYHTQNVEFLSLCFEAASITLSHALRFIDISNLIIKHGGWPDHTYDVWACSGISAYSGGLWVAALDAYQHMVFALGQTFELLRKQLRLRIQELESELGLENANVDNEKHPYRLPKSKKDSSFNRKKSDGHQMHYTLSEISNQIESLQFVLTVIQDESSSSGIDDNERNSLLNETPKSFANLVNKAESSWSILLWDENYKYFRYDSSNNKTRTVHSDQLAGVWFAQSSGLGFGFMFKDKCQKALEAIMKFNVNEFHRGTWSAVNGMNPKTGKIHNSCLQSRETWTGVCYGLAALLWSQGMKTEAMQVAKGIFNCCWNDSSLWFQTPEAYDSSGCYRSLCYMRPLSAWAIVFEINREKRVYHNINQI